MNRKDQKIRKKFGITAASSDLTTKKVENEVVPSPVNGQPEEQTTVFPENAKEKKEVALVSRLRVSEDLTVSYHVETRPGFRPRPFVSIDRKVGKGPDGKPKWVHIRLYDENSLEDLKTGLDKMLEMALLPVKYLHLKVEPETLKELQQNGVMDEVHKYVAQIP